MSKRLIFPLLLFSLLWGFSCESPISTDIKSGDLSRTEFSVYFPRNEIFDPAWSPDGERITFVSKTMATDIYKMSAAGDTLELVKRFFKSLITSDGSISPDGQYLIYIDSDWDVNTGKNSYLYSVTQDTGMIITDILPLSARRFRWSRDGSVIYYKISGYTIVAMTPGGAPVFSVTLDSIMNFQDYDVSPDKQSIVWYGRPQNHRYDQIWHYTPENGQQKLLAADSIYYKLPAWSPDGSCIAYYTENRKTDQLSLNIYSLKNNSSRTLVDSTGYISRIVWSDDGQTVYFTGYYFGNDISGGGIWAVSLPDNIISLNCPCSLSNIFQLDADGSFYLQEDYPVYQLSSFSVTDKKITFLSPKTREEMSCPDWSPDGASLVFTQDRKLCRIHAGDGETESLNIDNPYNQFRPDFSPDGSLLVFDDGDEIYTVSAKGGQAKKINTGNYDLYNPVWSPDGKQIACAYNRYDTDSLMVFNYTNEKLSRAKAWPGIYLDISWSKLHPVLGSFILLVQPRERYDMYGLKLKALNPENGQLLELIGNGGSLLKDLRGEIKACWSPDAEAIAWIHVDYPTYSLNIARIFVDLQ
ncbi:PD40 domain-containing protein [candidate division KSB1 bacterium]|nr:PD40 domain-containing protein [candidate division KSB1 bacterium]